MVSDSKPRAEGSSNFSTGTFLAIMALIYALVIGALYYFAHVPEIEAREAAVHEADRLDRDAAQLRAQVADLERMLADARQATEGLETRVQEREGELSSIRSTQLELIAIFEQEIADGQIQVERMRDNLRVDLVNEVLFDSGEVALNPEGVDVLRRVGEVLNQAQDRQIIVQGHTDNVPIRGRLAERYATNWELSTARAVNVARFLQEQVAVDPTRLSAVGFSEYWPREANETPEGRQMNRRIEILLAPLPER
jgi:chemotaxis protein MotB